MVENYIYTPVQTIGGQTFGGYYSTSAVTPEQTIYAVTGPSGYLEVGGLSSIASSLAAAGQSTQAGLQQVPQYFGYGLATGAGAGVAALEGLNLGLIILLLAGVAVATR